MEKNFDLFGFFAGKTHAVGLFYNPIGQLQRQFVVEMSGTVQDNTLTLDERFVFDDGERTSRVWTIKQVDTKNFVGTAADVVGEATGMISGNQLRWAYDLRLPIGKNGLVVRFDDVMIQPEPATILNRAVMKKFGVPLGQLFLSFRRV